MFPFQACQPSHELIPSPAWPYNNSCKLNIEIIKHETLEIISSTYRALCH